MDFTIKVTYIQLTIIILKRLKDNFMSSLKATIKGKYRKPSGQLVYTYFVTGTAKDLAAYKTAQAEAIGKAVEDLTLDENGRPMFWFVANPLQGRIAQKTFALDITQNGRIVVDDTMSGVERDIKVSEMSMEHEARIIAEAKFGLVKVNTATNNAAPVAAAPAAPAEEKLEQPIDEIEQAAAELQGAEQPAGTLDTE